jgi:hypothetical protein
MPDRDWDKELADIDRRIGDAPNAAAAGRAGPVPGPARPPHAPVPPAQAPRRGVGTPVGAPGRRSWRAQIALLLRLALGVAVVAALVYWPYPARCGAGLAYYLLLVAALAVAGLATATSAWRHRAPFVHVLGLAMLVAAAVLGARDVLPRVGYACPRPNTRRRGAARSPRARRPAAPGGVPGGASNAVPAPALSPAPTPAR